MPRSLKSSSDRKSLDEVKSILYLMQDLSQHQQWLQLHQEEIIDPDRPIIDPHHHLWKTMPGIDPYLLEDLWADTNAGHNITHTVFMECRAEYDTAAPEHLQSVGETKFVTELAKKSEQGAGATIAAIIARTDLRKEAAMVEEAIAAHIAVSEGRFRGIRQPLSCAPEGVALLIPGDAPKDLYADENFRKGVRLLGKMGCTYDSWHYHFQNKQFLALAQAAPDTQLVLDHFGTPLGVPPYDTQRQEIFETWKKDIAAIAKCENVVAKIGGLAMPDNGFGWFGRATPPSSDEFAAAQAPYYHHTIECFGPDRCMFESNFPVDKLSISYPVLWNGLKKIAARYSEAEQDALFRGTASRVYRLAI